jgi:hypothetical protein
MTTYLEILCNLSFTNHPNIGAVMFRNTVLYLQLLLVKKKTDCVLWSGIYKWLNRWIPIGTFKSNQQHLYILYIPQYDLVKRSQKLSGSYIYLFHLLLCIAFSDAIWQTRGNPSSGFIGVYTVGITACLGGDYRFTSHVVYNLHNWLLFSKEHWYWRSTQYIS